MPPAPESVEAVSVPVLPLASGVGEVLRLPPVKPALDDPLCAFAGVIAAVHDSRRSSSGPGSL